MWRRSSVPLAAAVALSFWAAASGCESDAGDPELDGGAHSLDASAHGEASDPDPSDGSVDSQPADRTPIGSDALTPGQSCLDIQTQRAARGNGPYWIRPPGTSAASAAFQVLCDMTADAGGWTLVANYPLGLQITPPGWSTTGVEGSVFHAENTVFKLADATIHALKTTGYRVRSRASTCFSGACTLDHTLYFKPACNFSSIATSADCSTAYLDSSFARLTPAGKAPEPCPWHRGLVDYQCNVKGGVVTNHDPAIGGTTICVGELDVDKLACVPRGAERAGVQIWVR